MIKSILLACIFWTLICLISYIIWGYVGWELLLGWVGGIITMTISERLWGI